MRHAPPPPPGLEARGEGRQRRRSEGRGSCFRLRRPFRQWWGVKKASAEGRWVRVALRSRRRGAKEKPADREPELEEEPELARGAAKEEEVGMRRREANEEGWGGRWR